MGKHADAAGLGPPYRHAPASLASAIWDFDPRASDVDGAPGIPDPPDFSLVNWKTSADRSTRIDFPGEFAPSCTRVWGYVARIDEPPFASTLLSYIFAKSNRRRPFLKRASRILATVLKSFSVFPTGFATTDLARRKQAGFLHGCAPIVPTR